MLLRLIFDPFRPTALHIYEIAITLKIRKSWVKALPYYC